MLWCSMQQVAAYRDDGGRYVLASIDDLLDSGNSQGDIHTGNASKVEGLQSHLGSRLSNTLCPKCTHCGPCRLHTYMRLREWSQVRHEGGTLSVCCPGIILATPKTACAWGDLSNLRKTYSACSKEHPPDTQAVLAKQCTMASNSSKCLQTNSKLLI